MSESEPKFFEREGVLAVALVAIIAVSTPLMPMGIYLLGGLVIAQLIAGALFACSYAEIPLRDWGVFDPNAASPSWLPRDGEREATLAAALLLCALAGSNWLFFDAPHFLSGGSLGRAGPLLASIGLTLLLLGPACWLMSVARSKLALAAPGPLPWVKAPLWLSALWRAELKVFALFVMLNLLLSMMTRLHTHGFAFTSGPLLSSWEASLLGAVSLGAEFFQLGLTVLILLRLACWGTRDSGAWRGWGKAMGAICVLFISWGLLDGLVRNLPQSSGPLIDKAGLQLLERLGTLCACSLLCPLWFRHALNYAGGAWPADARPLRWAQALGLVASACLLRGIYLNGTASWLFAAFTLLPAALFALALLGTRAPLMAAFGIAITLAIEALIGSPWIAPMLSDINGFADIFAYPLIALFCAPLCMMLLEKPWKRQPQEAKDES